LKLLVKQI